jgi:NAD(P)-dependent dehydrogenase (short-subunit alcohol dehydrogenase family)
MVSIRGLAEDPIMKEQHTTDVQMNGRVCIVTGANSGIGYETSIQLAKHGAHLVMVCRNRQKGEKAKAEIDRVAKGKVDLILADLSSIDEIRRLARVLLDKYPKIHVLINNAGVQYNTRRTSVDGYEITFAVNYLALFLLTRLLLDRIKASAPARIINIASKAHRFGGLDLNDLQWENRRYSGMKTYAASKIANILFTKDLSERLAGTGVTVNAVHPGEVLSNAGMENGPVYLFIRRHMINRLLKPTDIAGEAVFYHAASPELEKVTGEYFDMTHPEKPWGNANNRPLGRILWPLSEALTGISPKENPV